VQITSNHDKLTHGQFLLREPVGKRSSKTKELSYRPYRREATGPFLVNYMVTPWRNSAGKHFATRPVNPNPTSITTMNESLLPSRFLFRFAAPCMYRKDIWGDDGVKLPAAHRLAALEELEGGTSPADVRAAWNETGLALWVQVKGKSHAPRCHEARLDSSDGVRVWIDTRDTHNVHRASRFCHEFIFLPAGAGTRGRDPVAEQVLIHRARENAKLVRGGTLGVRSEVRKDGYVLSGFIPAAALAGYEPADHPRLGFQYALVDHDLGVQTFSVGAEFPYETDPSVWGTLELVH